MASIFTLKDFKNTKPIIASNSFPWLGVVLYQPHREDTKWSPMCFHLSVKLGHYIVPEDLKLQEFI